MKNIFKKKNKNVTPITFSSPLTEDEKKVVVKYRKSGKFKFYLYKVLKIFGVIFFIVVTFLLGYCSGSSGSVSVNKPSKKGSSLGASGASVYTSVDMPMRAIDSPGLYVGAYDFMYPFASYNAGTNVTYTRFYPHSQGVNNPDYDNNWKTFSLFYSYLVSKEQPDDQEIDLTYYFYSDYVGDFVNSTLLLQQTSEFYSFADSFSVGFGEFYCLGYNEGQTEVPTSEQQLVRLIDFSNVRYYDIKIDNESISPAGPFGFPLGACNFTGFDLSGNFPNSPYSWQWFRVPFVSVKFKQVRASWFSEDNPVFTFRLKWSVSETDEDIYNAGYSEGQKNPGGISSVFGMFSNAVGQMGNILNIQLVPGIQIGTILFIPIAGALLVWLIKLIRGA